MKEIAEQILLSYEAKHFALTREHVIAAMLEFSSIERTEGSGEGRGQQEYFDKTKKLLNRILKEYSCSWISKPLEELEYPNESICDKCKGCGTFKKTDGEEGDCYIDREQGECYYRFMDAEQFGLEVEALMDEINELAYVDELLNTDKNPERSVAREDDSSNAVGNKKEVSDEDIERVALEKYCTPYGKPTPSTYAFIAGYKAALNNKP